MRARQTLSVTDSICSSRHLSPPLVSLSRDAWECMARQRSDPAGERHGHEASNRLPSIGVVLLVDASLSHGVGHANTRPVQKTLLSAARGPVPFHKTETIRWYARDRDHETTIGAYAAGLGQAQAGIYAGRLRSVPSHRNPADRLRTAPCERSCCAIHDTQSKHTQGFPQWYCIMAYGGGRLGLEEARSTREQLAVAIGGRMHPQASKARQKWCVMDAGVRRKELIMGSRRYMRQAGGTEGFRIAQLRDSVRSACWRAARSRHRQVGLPACGHHVDAD